MAIEHVQDSTVSTQTTGATINPTFGVAPSRGNLVVGTIVGYDNVGPGSRRRLPRTPPTVSRR